MILMRQWDLSQNNYKDSMKFLRYKDICINFELVKEILIDSENKIVKIVFDRDTWRDIQFKSKAEMSKYLKNIK
jgi:hypothetical protein